MNTCTENTCTCIDEPCRYVPELEEARVCEVRDRLWAWFARAHDEVSHHSTLWEAAPAPFGLCPGFWRDCTDHDPDPNEIPF